MTFDEFKNQIKEEYKDSSSADLLLTAVAFIKGMFDSGMEEYDITELLRYAINISESLCRSEKKRVH